VSAQFASPVNNFVGAITIGAIPAVLGAVRLANHTAVYSRNSTNTGDIRLIIGASDNNVYIGENASGVIIQAGTVTLQPPVTLSSYVQMTEIAAPSGPAANRAYLWLEDNGSGKSRLMVRFNTGAAVQIAIEP
jgi:hypothetical protein